MTHDLGDAPIETEYYAALNHVAHAIDIYFNAHCAGHERKTGFVLLTFKYGESEGRCNFISNGANRGDIACMFKEMIARLQGQPEMKGTA